MTKFIQRCGDCPKWEEGCCKKYDQERHERRELCKPVWDQEIKRLAKLAKAKDSQVKILLLEKAVLDPKRTMEALGYKWEKDEKPKTTEST